MYLTSTKLTKNELVSFIITIGALYLLRGYIAARAQLVTFILFALTVYSIEMLLETGKKRYGIYLFIIPVLIANLHLAVWPFFFILFLPYIGEYILSFIADNPKWTRNIRIKILKRKLLKQKDEQKLKKIQEKINQIDLKYISLAKKQKKLKENPYKIEITRNKNTILLIIMMMICVVTGLLTPFNGIQPYTHLYNLMRGNTTQSINEHLPMTLINNIEFLGVVVIFLGILIFTDTKIKLKDLFMTGGLIILALKTRRQASMVFLLCSVILTRLVTAIFNKYDKGGCEKVVKQAITVHGKIIVVSLVLIVSLLIIEPKIGEEFILESSYPVHATEYIKENIDLETMKLYNEYNYGSYLLLQDIPVFIDSRSEPYAPEFTGKQDIFSDFINISNIGVYYETKFEEYNITHVILYKNARLNMFLSRNDDYEELYSDDYFVIYKRLIAI